MVIVLLIVVVLLFLVCSSLLIRQDNLVNSQAKLLKVMEEILNEIKRAAKNDGKR